MKKHLHVEIGGIVQGVGFRAFVMEKATHLGITGWVRNRWDGSVEVVAEAEQDLLNQFLGCLRQGPRGSHVSELDFYWLDPDPDDYFQDFRIRRTE